MFMTDEGMQQWPYNTLHVDIKNESKKSAKQQMVLPMLWTMKVKINLQANPSLPGYRYPQDDSQDRPGK